MKCRATIKRDTVEMYALIWEIFVLFINQKASLQQYIQCFNCFIYRDLHKIFFSATSNKKQLSVGYFWGKGQEGEVNLYHFKIVSVWVL